MNTADGYLCERKQVMFITTYYDFFAAVDFASFLKLMGTRSADQESEEDLNEAFRVFDKDGQGDNTVLSRRVN